MTDAPLIISIFGIRGVVALAATGCVVLDLAKCSTPAAKRMVTELGAQGSIILTASHNPAPWNGLKPVRADGVFLNAAQGARVESAFRGGDSVRRAAPGAASNRSPRPGPSVSPSTPMPIASPSSTRPAFPSGRITPWPWRSRPSPQTHGDRGRS